MEERRSLGGEMELLKLSRLKLQLRALISEARDLRRTIHHRAIPSLNSEAIRRGIWEKVEGLESELALSIESQQKLERQVSYLQNDNALLENKQKELNDTIQSLLQSREHFVYAYQDSTCELKRSIETRDRKLKVLSEKIKSHVLLLDSIEKEALSVKHVVDNVRHAVNKKAEVVTGLKRKFDRVSEVEKVFMDKIVKMENSIKRYKDELQMKDKIISELHLKLKAEQKCNKRGTEIEKLQRTLSMKEAVIQNLMSEKQVLDSEVKSLEAILEKTQQSFRDMNEAKPFINSPVSGRKSFPSLFESQGRGCMIPEVVNRIEDSKANIRKDSESHPALGGSVECAAYSQLNPNGESPFMEMPEKIETQAQVEEPACSTTQSACSGPQSTTHAQIMSNNEPKSNCTITTWQPESESSTTQAETLNQRG